MTSISRSHGTVAKPRPTHLAAAPEPDTAAPADETPETRAYHAGRHDAHAEQVDDRYRALANLTRLEAMDLPGLESAASIIAAIIRTKRTQRPALQLVGPGSDREDYGIAYLAAAAVNAAAASPALQDDIAGDYEAMGQPGLVLSFTRAVGKQRAIVEAAGGVA